MDTSDLMIRLEQDQSFSFGQQRQRLQGIVSPKSIQNQQMFSNSITIDEENQFRFN